MLLLDHFDCLIRYAVVTQRALSGPPKLVIPPRPGLGWWADQIGKIAETDAFRGVKRLLESDRIVHLRNERRGHGYVQAGTGAYGSDVQTLELALARLEAVLLPVLRETTPVLVRGMNLQSGTYHVFGDRLVGSNSLFASFDLQLPQGVAPTSVGLESVGHVVLWNEAKTRFITLDPYVRETICPDCRHPRVLLADGDVYIDVLLGHRVKLA
jgi:hypothetical protein